MTYRVLWYGAVDGEPGGVYGIRAVTVVQFTNTAANIMFGGF